MTELHSALKALGPEDWEAVPTSEAELDTYLANLFTQCETIIDTVPIEPPPEKASNHSRSNTQSSANSAHEISPSAERSAAPSNEHEKLQKEWGKALKLKQAENPLSMSVYKLSGKDGKGAWFARRSVHEGIGFNKFKKSLEMEFAESMAEPGPPGTGNVRGIGGEEKVEDIKVPHRGRVEVYRLSAQFPGPTTPRDFVTLLITSSKVIKEDSQKRDGGLSPRHYMILSKPCNHPKTQPKNGFIRGFYESVEFIREVPRKLKTSQSSMELDKMAQSTGDLEKDVLKLNAQKAQTMQHSGDESPSHLAQLTQSDSQINRKRAVTTGSPDGRKRYEEDNKAYDPEDNPVEWIMITRSDPGGSVPRFMVERGTPSSICSDAVKFLDWACQKDFDENEQVEKATGVTRNTLKDRRESFQSWRARSTVGLEEFPKTDEAEMDTQPSEAVSHGLWDTVTGAAAATLRPYTPQAVLDHLPGHSPSSQLSPEQSRSQILPAKSPEQDDGDDHSIKSTTSFASAEDHLSSSSSDNDGDPDAASLGSPGPKTTNEEKLSHHEKELLRLDQRRETLQKKYASTNSKLQDSRARAASKEELTLQKSLEKHDRERQKYEAKYKKELARIEQKQERERKKMAERKRKQEDKDEKRRLTRERDEARQQLDLSKKEADSLRNLVQELQKENTTLVMKLGRLGVVGSDKDIPGSGASLGEGDSQASSLSTKTGGSGKKKDKDEGTKSAGASMKSNLS